MKKIIIPIIVIIVIVILMIGMYHYRQTVSNSEEQNMQVASNDSLEESNVMDNTVENTISSNGNVEVGTTERRGFIIDNVLHSETQGDIYFASYYPERYDETKEYAIYSQYKKIVLITSTWWYGITPVMKKFLKEYDLSGKDIIVASSNAGWLGHCFKDYENLLPNANIKGELDLVFSAEAGRRDEMLTSQKKIDDWIEKL